MKKNLLKLTLFLLTFQLSNLASAQWTPNQVETSKLAWRTAPLTSVKLKAAGFDYITIGIIRDANQKIESTSVVFNPLISKEEYKSTSVKNGNMIVYTTEKKDPDNGLANFVVVGIDTLYTDANHLDTAVIEHNVDETSGAITSALKTTYAYNGNEVVKINAAGNILKRVKNDHVFAKFSQENLGQKFFFFEGYDSLNYPDRMGFVTDTNFNFIESFKYPYKSSSWKIDAIMPENDTTLFISFIVNDSSKTHNTTITEIVKFRFNEASKTFDAKRNFPLYFNQLGNSNCKTCFTYPTHFFRSEFDGGFYFLLESYFSKEIGWVGKCDSLGNIDFIDPNSFIEMNPPLFVGEKQPKNNKLEVFPNPASGLAFVKGLPNAGTISILNAQGKLVCHSKTTGNHCTIETEFLPIGIYFIQFQSDDGCCTRFGKLVVEN